MDNQGNRFESTEENDGAATKIQCAYRQKAAKKRISQMKTDRKLKFQLDMETELEDASARVLQAKCKEKYGAGSAQDTRDTARPDTPRFEPTEETDGAATKIQCAYRQKSAMKKVNTMKAERKIKFQLAVESELEETSARVLQAKCKEKYGGRGKKSLTEGRPVRPGTPRFEPTEETDGAATKIQCAYRQKSAMKKVGQMKVNRKIKFEEEVEKELEDASARVIQAKCKQKYGFTERPPWAKGGLSDSGASYPQPPPPSGPSFDVSASPVLSGNPPPVPSVRSPLNGAASVEYPEPPLPSGTSFQYPDDAHSPTSLPGGDPLSQSPEPHGTPSDASSSSARYGFFGGGPMSMVQSMANLREAFAFASNASFSDNTLSSVLSSRHANRLVADISELLTADEDTAYGLIQEIAAIVIQAAIRRLLAQATYQEIRQSVLKIQSASRQKAARTKVKRLKVARNEGGLSGHLSLNDQSNTDSQSACMFTPSHAQLREAFALASVGSFSTFRSGPSSDERLLQSRHLAQLISDPSKMPVSEQAANELLEEVAAIVLQSFARRIIATAHVQALRQRGCDATTTADEAPPPPGGGPQASSPWVTLNQGGERPTTVVYEFRSRTKGNGLSSVFSVAMLEAMSSRADDTVSTQTFAGLQCLHSAAMAKKDQDPMYLPRLEKSRWTVGGGTVKNLLLGPRSQTPLTKKHLLALGSAKIATSLQHQQAYLIGDDSLLMSPPRSEPMSPAVGLSPPIAASVPLASRSQINPRKHYSQSRICTMGISDVEQLVRESRQELSTLATRSKIRTRHVAEMRMEKSDVSSGVTPCSNLETVSHTRKDQLPPLDGQSRNSSSLHFRGTLSVDTVRALDRYEEEERNTPIPNHSDGTAGGQLPRLVVHRHPAGMGAANREERQKILDDILVQGGNIPQNAQVSPAPFGGQMKGKRVLGRLVGGKKGLKVKPFVAKRATASDKAFSDDEQQTLKNHYLKNIVTHHDAKMKGMRMGGAGGGLGGIGKRF